jgi:antitoxin component YwqK of YwqJK toxin-antitoxin module
MKSVWIGLALAVSLFGNENIKVREYLLPRAPEWRAQIMDTYPSGVAKGIYFFEDRFEAGEVAVKRVLLNEDGTNSIEEDLEGENLHGLSAQFDRNGKISEIKSYKLGKLHGPQRKFYPNNQLKSEDFFEEGLASGKKTTFFEDGQKEFECNFVNGKIEGEAWWYYPSGKRKTLIPFKNGLKDGLLMEWHENGVVRLKINYEQDKEND